jgi:hypothetical protein
MHLLPQQLQIAEDRVGSGRAGVSTKVVLIVARDMTVIATITTVF